MAEPWFTDPNLFGGLYGGIVGSVGGILGGLLGAVSGRLVPQGKGRRSILGSMIGFVVFGAINLLVGLVAWWSGQPYAIWYPFASCGLIFVLVMGGLIPVMKRRYEEAESRRIDAAAIRRG
jgi:hypothetical protein